MVDEKNTFPLVSIITVVYNGEKYLERTIQSVINQTYENIEYIIIDGGSTDRTLNIIKKYDKYISYWISEKDNGIYDAMNKGVKVARGKYITFLNADDWYNNNSVVEAIIKNIKNDIDFVYANIYYAFPDGSYKLWKGDTRCDGTRIPHPSCFIKTSLLKKEGFNQTYKIAADYEMTLRLFNKNIQKQYIDYVVANFRVGGISTSSFFQTTYESFIIDKQYFGILKALKHMIIKVYSFIFNKIKS